MPETLRARARERRVRGLCATDRLADKSGASEPLQLAGAIDAREIAEAAERELTQPQEPPKQLMPPKPKPEPDEWSIYTRDELRILCEANRVTPFTPAELREVHEIKSTFHGRITK